jgi:hypothetical protein
MTSDKHASRERIEREDKSLVKERCPSHRWRENLLVAATFEKANTLRFADSPIRNAEVRAKLFTSASGHSVRATKVGCLIEIDIPIKV